MSDLMSREEAADRIEELEIEVAKLRADNDCLRYRCLPPDADAVERDDVMRSIRQLYEMFPYERFILDELKGFVKQLMPYPQRGRK